jgi:hypothetical protein
METATRQDAARQPDTVEQGSSTQRPLSCEDAENEIFRIIHDHPEVSEKCNELPLQFRTLPYIDRLNGFLDIIESVQGKSQQTQELRSSLNLQNENRRRRDDPGFCSESQSRH